MMLLACPILLLVMLLATQAHSAGAPDALKGKSVILTWSETSQQRYVGEPNFYSVNRSANLTVYVSTAGRVFSRRTTSTRAGSGTIEQGPGEGGRAYPTRGALFGAQTMTLIGETKGGARRTLIDFDASFTSCSARVALAFQSGKTSVSLSPITKKYVEIKSVTVNGTSCSVKTGNVLAGAT
ncbi:hypothetical protein V1292_005608 [Bradyrhizobium sp. AZCC 1719]|uniref:hypothetical protein n=1 Tax=Bradyrhizobium sp. AZCC 1719 TaxID=3117028 RepID=UPI002FF21541